MKSIPTFAELQKPLPAFSLKALYYRTIRSLLKSVGNLADGIRIGNQYGYDSGVMLDYVYKNQANGQLLIGKLLDRLYLNTVGWRGIRLRKHLLKEVLFNAIADQLARKLSLQYLDIACGGGDYDLDVLRQFDPQQIQAELRDYKQENLDQAQANARQQRVTNVQFRQADAFDAANYDGRWDVIVVSGFWEIIDNDHLVKQCLANLACCLPTGGSLIFTIQPYHPQLEFIARALTSNTGKPWIMRLRSLELFQAWLREVGLAYVSHQLEQHGIFGVVQAVKV